MSPTFLDDQEEQSPAHEHLTRSRLPPCASKLLTFLTQSNEKSKGDLFSAFGSESATVTRLLSEEWRGFITDKGKPPGVPCLEAVGGQAGGSDLEGGVLCDWLGEHV